MPKFKALALTFAFLLFIFIGNTLAQTRIQVITAATAVTGGTSISMSVEAPPVNGNTLVALITTHGKVAYGVSSITQTGATWSRAVQATHAEGTTTEIWFAPNVTNAATGILINLTNKVRAAAIVIEYSGILAVSPLDQVAFNTGNVSPASTGTTPTTSQANELWIGGIGINNSTLSNITNSFVQISTISTGTGANTAQMYALERIVNSTDNAYTGGTLAANKIWSGAIATFKAKAVTTTTVSSNSNPSIYGNSVTFTAQVLPATATGTVTFKDGATTIGTGNLSSGSATYTTSNLSVSNHIISAVYNGDGSHFSSTSDNLSQDVQAPISVSWVGTTIDWGTSLNWSPTYVPTATTNVVIPNATNDPLISSSTAAECNNLTLESGALLTIASTGASATGSLIVTGTASTGTYNVQRWVPAVNNDWHIISCPVTGSGTMQTFASTQGVNPGTGDYDLAPYAEKKGLNAFGDWDPYILQVGTNNFATGYGYAMRRQLTTPGIVTFTGTGINTGTIGSINITRSANGWNALGNPYTSAINIATFISANSSQLEGSPYNVVYVWDPAADDYDGIGSGDVALGQGFMVKSKTGGGSISFTAAMQNDNIVTFKSAEMPFPTVQLKVTSGNLMNKTVVKFEEGMTNELDNLKDIGKFKGNPDIALYTRMPGNAAYDLQDQALPALGEELVRIPVGLDLLSGGEVTFSAQTEAFPTWAEVYIEDTSIGKLTLLNDENSGYTTTVAAATKGAGRFNLVIQKNLAVGVVTNEIQNEFNIFTRNREIVINGEADSNTRLELFSIEGKCLYSIKAQRCNLNTIDGSSFPAGIYLLKISKENSVQTSKLVLSGN